MVQVQLRVPIWQGGRVRLIAPVLKTGNRQRWRFVGSNPTPVAIKKYMTSLLDIFLKNMYGCYINQIVSIFDGVGKPSGNQFAEVNVEPSWIFLQESD